MCFMNRLAILIVLVNISAVVFKNQVNGFAVSFPCDSEAFCATLIGGKEGTDGSYRMSYLPSYSQGNIYQCDNKSHCKCCKPGTEELLKNQYGRIFTGSDVSVYCPGPPY
ncbi:hypothetical protein KEM48_006518 [Puccinia striiformis f. sp. tritici PST-130]|nr:hypothetical protein KEM48_006518 [Puccinia striiformis f. sp. tritici PST-130]